MPCTVSALYYNRAAAKTLELNKYADDYSKEGIKKYEQLKEEIFKEFDQVPCLISKKRRLNPNDMNTLIALRRFTPARMTWKNRMSLKSAWIRCKAETINRLI